MNHALRDHLGMKLVFMNVAVPHFNKVLRTNNQRFKKEVFFKHFSQRGCGDRFAEADHITNHHAPALMQVVSCNQHRFLLKIQQFLLKYSGQFIFTHTSPRLT